jgi:hypothetical protein
VRVREVPSPDENSADLLAKHRIDEKLAIYQTNLYPMINFITRKEHCAGTQVLQLKIGGVPNRKQYLRGYERQAMLFESRLRNKKPQAAIVSAMSAMVAKLQIGHLLQIGTNSCPDR